MRRKRALTLIVLVGLLLPACQPGGQPTGTDVPDASATAQEAPTLEPSPTTGPAPTPAPEVPTPSAEDTLAQDTLAQADDEKELDEVVDGQAEEPVVIAGDQARLSEACACHDRDCIACVAFVQRGCLAVLPATDSPRRRGAERAALFVVSSRPHD